MPPNLDPDSDNILGKGRLPAEQEAALITDGYVFAMWVQPVPSRKGDNPPPFLCRCKRIFADAATDALLDAYHASFLPELASERSVAAPATPVAAEFVPV